MCIHTHTHLIMSEETSATMLAYRFNAEQSRLVAERVPIPVPSPGQVLVKILAAGVCHTDIGVLDAKGQLQAIFNADSKSFTLGHEGAGRCGSPLLRPSPSDSSRLGVIVALGTEVADKHPDLCIGTYVALYAEESCFQTHCYSCSHSMSNLCTTAGYGMNLDGTWASYVAIRAGSLVPVPATQEQVPPGAVSASTDAVLTPYHAMKTRCNLQPEHTVLCLGVGGLGYNAVAIAKKALGVRCVIACDVREQALENAKEAGADYVATPEDLQQVLSTNQLVVDFAFDFVGSQQTFDLCYASVRGGGTIHLVGIGGHAVEVSPLAAMLKDLTIKARFYGTKQELVEILQLVADGGLQPKVEMRPMSDVFQVLEDLHHGKLESRVALVPSE